ncbi:MAG TPA: tetratricopeptide repeat protein [Xanthobacteraceae bacterium]|nr:tetratricopeptide repeat protein [Xanthobacteraceae bacterium]
MTASNPFLPSMPAAPPASRAREDEVLQQALILLDKNRPQEAAQIAGQVLKAQPHLPRALYVLGCALIMQGRAAEALTPLDAAIRGRHDAEIETMLAIALRQAGRNEDALRRLKLATKRRPPYAGAFHELGRLLAAMQRDEEAIAAFRGGLAVAPMMPALSVQLGQIFLRQRNCAEAKLAFARALEIAPNSSEALFGLARAHQEIGENEPAATYFRRYLAGRPGDQTAWLQLGHCLLELGQLEAGYDCFRKAAGGEAEAYGAALTSLSAAGRGRFWLKPSDASRFMRRGPVSA